jgi:uncharacterized membrane protein (UPF0136 family)
MLATIALYSLPVVALLVAVGGIMGFVKAQSKASLIAGIASGLLLLLAFFLALNSANGLFLAAIVNLALIIVFGIRLKKTGKFMPAGLMLVICAVDLALVVAGLLAH